jgi:hypothetical protein
MKTKQQILEERRLINEALFSVENILMTLGYFPIIGEVADILLIIHYLRKGENLYAALMLIALIPTVGDILVKPFIKTLQVGKKTLKNTNNLVEALNKNPKVTSKLKELVGDESKLTKAFELVKNNEKYKKYLPENWMSSIEKGLTSIKKVLPKVTPLEAIKSGVKSATTGGKFSTGLKNFYRGERLSKYIAKRGMEPSNFIQKWWINYGAGKDRRDSFRRFIVANNMLELFGLPNVGSFEDKLENDKNFRDKVADNPQMSEFIAQNSSDTDLNPNKEVTKTNGMSGFMNMLSLPMLKILANKFA